MVIEGVNVGDGFFVLGDFCLGDVYEFCDNGLFVFL